MVSYLIRRLLLAALTLLLITFAVYALIRNMPGTPLTLDLATADPSKRISKEEEERLIDMDQVARACGLGTADSLRGHLVRRTGLTPSAYRAQFSRLGTAA